MLSLALAVCLCLNVDAGDVHFEGEKYFKSVTQLTFGGANAEAYFSFDNKKLTYQAMGSQYGVGCDQIYQIDLEHLDVTPKRMSSGNGVCTCSYFLKDNKHIVYASTFLKANSTYENTCPIKQCSPANPENSPGTELGDLCKRKDGYFWDIFPDYDIFLANEYGQIVAQLTDEEGYDAEAVVSPDGNTILYTSMQTGDLELFMMDVNGSNKEQITNTLGYDGGAFFSPNGKKIVYRASRPQTAEEISHYKLLLKHNMVEPLDMEIFVYDIESGNHTQVTNLTGANWAPYYLSDNRRIIFSSNHENTGAFDGFSLYITNDDGTGLEKVTHADQYFDSFPMQSYDGKYLAFGSSRNGSSKYDINIFLAEWVDNVNNAAPTLTLGYLSLMISYLLLS
ncbi:unnamed protein product [Bursaphelenchus okinawaensis]|uniref:Uncharacterized protein n=1 Tax=Bursaphelenchus okinawaensis TaxID=465554 RepID=A0A811K7P7_9BILA|nr:unnamed protein product [Bursaphelenchus okinawaensis]CAG9093395.1 unnamed protein product [Bursaphelenchus okinawaensis]